MTKKVVYFRAGEVADFELSDTDYAEFTEQLKGDQAILDERLLDSSRVVLLDFIDRGATGITDIERSAAGFIWYFFNDSGREGPVTGDIVIVDEDGKGREIQYLSLESVGLSQT